jgi:hypothetical protein
MFCKSKGHACYYIFYALFSNHGLPFVGMDVRGSSQWLSSNEKVVHINRITGEAQARGEGIAEV